MKRNEFIRRILGGLSALVVAPGIIANIREDCIDNPGPGTPVTITLTKESLDNSFIFHHCEFIEVQEDAVVSSYCCTELAISDKDAPLVNTGEEIVFNNGEKCLILSNIKASNTSGISYVTIASMYNEAHFNIRKGEQFIIGSSYFMEGDK